MMPSAQLLHLLDDDAVLELGAELGGVLGELLRELPAENVLEPGVVLDELGIEQLAPGNPRSSTTALSIERPAYIPAHMPAGPAPTMTTS